VALRIEPVKEQIYGVSENDVATFAAVALFFVGVGVAAALVPARRAAGVDPMMALRAE
jgi:ABC-type antimicrobial peptide transport system permease subunit